MQRTSFSQRFRETNTQVVYEITGMRKAKYLFARMDLDGTEVDPDVILKRRMAPVQNSLERCWCRMKSQWSSSLRSQRSCLNWNFIMDTGMQVASQSTEQT